MGTLAENTGFNRPLPVQLRCSSSTTSFPVLLHSKAFPFSPEMSILRDGPGKNELFVFITCNHFYTKFMLCCIQTAYSFIMHFLKRRLGTLGLSRGLSCAGQATVCFHFWNPRAHFCPSDVRNVAGFGHHQILPQILPSLNPELMTLAEHNMRFGSKYHCVGSHLIGHWPTRHYREGKKKHVGFIKNDADTQRAEQNL